MNQSMARFPRPQSRLGKVWSFILLLWIFLWPVSDLRGSAGDSASVVRYVLLAVLVVLGIPLAIRMARRKLLWKLSSRLVITYLLIGLAPFVLLLTLFGLLGYSLAGQFAIVAATTQLDQSVGFLSSENRAFAVHAAHDYSGGKLTISNAEFAGGKDTSPPTVTVYVDDKYVPLQGGPPVDAASVLTAPAWTQGSFSGVVDDNHHLFIRAVDTMDENGHVVTVISSEPLGETRLAHMGRDLGRVTLFGTGSSKGQSKLSIGKPSNEVMDFNPSPSGGKTPVGVNDAGETQVAAPSIVGGTLPQSQGFYDINVTFLTLLPLHRWTDGTPVVAPLSVSSRPAALYHRLFAISNTFGNILRVALISLAIMFALIEVLALIMAAGLNRTITKSVSDLYEATVRVDSGDLSHQITVERNDQLAELSRSFNRMTSSLQRLIVEQKEKERLQNELTIAQEVQNNLFPRGDIRLPLLEIHGICRPARSVSGDYYDFLVFGENALGLALGDISGKGISAALLMATLHSAVRAYRFAAEELIQAEILEEALHASTLTGGNAFDCAGLFQSPARILSLLNRHLYRSTQPEKYATLWLGHYDGANRKLTYSNGGQLPPLVLRSQSSDIVRLDCGGTVVGLLDGMEYEEGSVVLDPGDIVVAYSDGVTEPENDFGDFGEQRMMDIVRRYRGEPLSTISAQVMLALDDWIGAQEQPDDITLVLARQM
jgi:sigma-B regulation protein RsbU (phosphoserine phosphatase)